MAWGVRHGVVYDKATGEIVSRPGDGRTPKGERGWARRALQASGQVKTFDFDTMEQVPATRSRTSEQGSLF